MDDKPKSQKWQVSTEADFLELMAEVDAELQSAGVQIHARQLQGVLFVSRRFGLGLSLVPNRRPPAPGVYTGDDLSLRISHWFEQRYGDRLKIDFAIGETVIVLRGDPYRVRLPKLWGAVKRLCDPANIRNDTYPTLGTKDVDAVWNVLDSIEQLTPAFAALMRPDELNAACREIINAHLRFESVAMMQASGLVQQAQSDLKTSVDCIFQVPPNFGNSRWHSLQAAEKYIKSYLDLKCGAYPTSGGAGHNLTKLSALGAPFGLHLSGEKLQKAQCSAQVRYNKEPSNIEQAVEAHRSAVDICAAVAMVARK